MMKRIISYLLALMLTLSLVGCGQTKPDEQTAAGKARIWIEKQIKENTLFSFEYDGVAHAEHIKKWKKSVEYKDNAWTVTYKKGDVTAWSEITLDEEMAAVEWTNYFRNGGTADSPVISNIQAIDSVVEVLAPILTTAYGSEPSAQDFEAYSVNLTKEPEFEVKTYGGRSSQGAWPYFDICNGEYGVMGGIGWTGNWRMSFANDNGNVRITAGMQETQIALQPDEQIRTPMFMLQFFLGDQDDGHNAFRQLILKNYTPSDSSGQPINSGFLGVSVGAGNGEEPLLTIAEKFKDTPYEFMWIDASWYGNTSGGTSLTADWGKQVGNWFTVDGFTDGNMKVLSDALHKDGKKLIVWFEPERAMPGTKWLVEHPDYFIKTDKDIQAGASLLDLSKDEACDFIIEYIGDFIEESGIDWYRQDFNIDPVDYWTFNDARLGENRKGITEIKYVTNEYRYLDALIERFPDLIIDSCASGGKRLDLEMMKRSIPMWRTDFADKPNATQATVRSINYNLSWWLPIHAGGFLSANYTAYNWRNMMASGMVVRNAIGDMDMLNTLFDQYLTCREMMTGDYYMLAYGVGGDAEKVNACYQYYLEEEGRGYLMAFCPQKGTLGTQSFRMKGLDPAATYEFEVTDTGDKLTATGEQLMNQGLQINFMRKESSFLIYYNKI